MGIAKTYYAVCDECSVALTNTCPSEQGAKALAFEKGWLCINGRTYLCPKCTKTVMKAEITDD